MRSQESDTHVCANHAQETTAYEDTARVWQCTYPGCGREVTEYEMRHPKRVPNPPQR